MVQRRAILKSAVVLAAGQWSLPEFGMAAAAAPPSQPFDYAWLKGQARKLAGSAFLPSQDALPPAMAKLSYDQFQSLRFRTTTHSGRMPASRFACSSSTSVEVLPNR